MASAVRRVERNALRRPWQPVYARNNERPGNSVCYLTPTEFVRARATERIVAPPLGGFTVDVPWSATRNLVVTPELSQISAKEWGACQGPILPFLAGPTEAAKQLPKTELSRCRKDD